MKAFCVFIFNIFFISGVCQTISTSPNKLIEPNENCNTEILKSVTIEFYNLWNSKTLSEAEYFITHYIQSNSIDSCMYSIELANLYAALFELYRKLNNTDKAYEYMDKSFSIIDSLYENHSPEMAFAMYRFGKFEMMLGDYDKAIKAFSFSYSYASKNDFSTEYRIEFKKGLAEAYRLSGQPYQALDLYSELFKMPELVGTDWDYAIRSNNMGALWDDVHQYNKAVYSYKEALSIFNNMNGNEDYLITTLSNLSSTYYTLDSLQQAEMYGMKAILLAKNFWLKNVSFLSEEERTAFIENFNGQIYNYYSIMSKQAMYNPYVLNSCLDFQIWKKGLIINEVENIKSIINSKKDTVLQKTYYDWEKQKEKLISIIEIENNKSDGEKLRLQQEKTYLLEKELSRSLSFFGEKATNITWQDIRQNIAPNEAIVDIFSFQFYNLGRTDTTFYAALILTSETKEHPKLILLKNGNDLDSIYYSHYQQYLTNPKQREDKDWESYRHYWAAIDSTIGDKKIVYVSPDGVYNKINLQTLVTSDGQYLSDKIDIRIIGSSRDLLSPSSPIKKSVKDALLVGNPNFKTNATIVDSSLLAVNQNKSDALLYTTRSFDNTDISQLPSAEKEVNTISALLKEHNYQTTTLIGNDAQEAQIKAVLSPSVLHIATHGFFEKDLKINNVEKSIGDNFKKITENPMLRSGLLLAGAENTIKGSYKPTTGSENGILTAYEVQQMNLDSTELVVLSACETGLGDVKNGEGVYGLQRAFRIAGAKTIIMSLWKVDDEATQLLMTSFYENWLSGKTKREAFKDAQEILKKSPHYSHPYYWGAFVMIGE